MTSRTFLPLNASVLNLAMFSDSDCSDWNDKWGKKGALIFVQSSHDNSFFRQKKKKRLNLWTVAADAWRLSNNTHFCVP